MKRTTFLLALLLALPAALARDAEYQVIVTTNIMVAMRDGVKLATDLYLPARNGAVSVTQLAPASEVRRTVPADPTA